MTHSLSLPEGFTLGRNFPATTLDPGERLDIEIIFQPSTPGNYSGTISIPFLGPDYQTFDFEVRATAELDVAAQTHIRTPQDIESIRKELIDYLWKGAGFPDRGPYRVAHNVQSPLPAIGGVASIDKLTSLMDLGFISVGYVFHPVTPNGRLAIFHQGHSSGLGEGGGNDTIQFFLDRGFTVLALWEPLIGPNKGPMADHTEMEALETPAVSPIKFFLEPVALALNSCKGLTLFETSR